MGDKGGKKNKSKAEKQKGIKKDHDEKTRKDNQAKRAPSAPA
jgi:hypothetical protein